MRGFKDKNFEMLTEFVLLALSQPEYVWSKSTKETKFYFIVNFEAIFKVNNKYSRTTYWRFSGVFIVNFDQISHIVLVFPWLT